MRRAALAAVLAGIALAGCKVNVKERGELPRVDVESRDSGGARIDVEPGRMPDVEVGTDSLKLPNVKVPEVHAPDVHLPDVKVPEVKAPHVDLPDVDRGRARTDTTRRP
jgi:hypothetical protein